MNTEIEKKKEIRRDGKRKRIEKRMREEKIKENAEKLEKKGIKEKQRDRQ